MTDRPTDCSVDGVVVDDDDDDDDDGCEVVIAGGSAGNVDANAGPLVAKTSGVYGCQRELWRRERALAFPS